MGWQVSGRTKVSRSSSAVGDTFRPARRHQKSAAEDDLEEKGQHVHCHVAEPSSRLAKS